MEWEKHVAEEMISALRPSGDVLQVGFGSGLLAGEIQKYRPKSHLIIEPNLNPKAKKWADSHSAVLLQEPWRRALPRLAVFDAILFAAPGKPELVRKGDELLRVVEESIPQLKKMHYTDSDLLTFCESSAQAAPEALVRFLFELEAGGQITKDQREKMVRKFKLKCDGVSPKVQTSSDWLIFLKQCLASHVRAGSRCTFFLETDEPLSDDRRFFEEIAVDPYVHVREWTIEPPRGPEMVILLIEKIA